jgi:predicted RNase H-like HicB family nuclease
MSEKARLATACGTMKQTTANRTRPRTVEINARVTAVIHPEPKAGGYSAEVPALPGCYTQGETLEEIESNLREAIEGWLNVGSKGTKRQFSRKVSQ